MPEASILDDVKAAATEIETGVAPEPAPSPEPAPTPEPAPEPTAAERARDESGRFAKQSEKPRETLKLKEKQPAAPAPSGPESTGIKPPEGVAATEGQAASKPGEEPIAAPMEWKGLAKTQWNKLPRSIQTEITEKLASFDERAQSFANLERAVAPHREVLTRDAGSVESGIGQLMEFYQLYLQRPVDLAHHILRSRGIDPRQAFGQQSQPAEGQGQQPPSTAQDIRQLLEQTVQRYVAPIQQRFQQTEEQQLTQTIQSFAADPRYPFFNDVKVQMGQLMQAGMATSLADAYDKAVKLNPAIQSHLDAQRTEDATKAKAAEAAKAKAAAAASLRGSPLPGVTPGATDKGASVLDDVRAAAAELAG
jgi:hypothetical protein